MWFLIKSFLLHDEGKHNPYPNQIIEAQNVEEILKLLCKNEIAQYGIYISIKDYCEITISGYRHQQEMVYKIYEITDQVITDHNRTELYNLLRETLQPPKLYETVFQASIFSHNVPESKERVREIGILFYKNNKEAYYETKTIDVSSIINDIIKISSEHQYNDIYLTSALMTQYREQYKVNRFKKDK